MRFDNSGILWAFEALANAGHPDPDGLIAKIESNNSTGNITAIGKEEAAKVGIRSIDEPVMSMFAATLFDAKHSRSYKVSDSRRDEINNRINNALFENTPPQNPFLDSEGFLILSKETPAFKEPNDSQLLESITKIMDETL